VEGRFFCYRALCFSQIEGDFAENRSTAASRGWGVDIFTIKGLKSGPTFLFDDQAPFLDILHAVEEELARAKGFFRDSPVVLHFGDRSLKKEEWRELKEILHREGLLLRYAVAATTTSRDLLYKEGLTVRDSLSLAGQEKPAAPAIEEVVNHSRGTALYLRRSLRSGQSEVCEGDVMLVGDVNQGAEVIAGGDAIILGTLRGMVHAGYPDNREAIVIALNLMPLQLRIGPFIARADEGHNPRRVSRPEVARVKEERIVIEPYVGKL
jgi:septum site-determining protein MinC